LNFIFIIMAQLNYQLLEGISQSRLKLIEKNPSEYNSFTYNDENKSKAMIRGSFVDEILLTKDIDASMSKFFNQNIVLNRVPSDKVQLILKTYADRVNLGQEESDDVLYDISQEIGYQSNWKKQTVLDALMKDGGDQYYMNLSSGKSIISREEKEKIFNIIRYFQSSNDMIQDILCDSLSQFHVPYLSDFKHNTGNYKIKAELDIQLNDAIFDFKIINQSLTTFFWSYFIGFKYYVQAVHYLQASKAETFTFVVYSTVEQRHACFTVSKVWIQRCIGIYGLEPFAQDDNYFTIKSREYITYNGLFNRLANHIDIDKWDMPYEYYLNEYNILPIDTWM